MSDNPPAFPRTAANPGWGHGTESYEGMTLRDWFAGQALAGMLAMHWSTEWPTAAADAYAMADAMLTERKKVTA